MAKLRVGIIGCGGIAKVHANGWRAVPGAELVACADVSLEAAERFAAEHGVARSYGDAAALLAEELDAVSLCTWVGTHAELTVAAARNGVKGILCEKPMARSLGEARAMLDAAEAHGAKLAIGYHHRFRAPNLTVRRLIADGAIGSPTLVHTRIEAGLANNGSHLLDRTLWWLDDAPVWVMGAIERKTNRHERREPIEDRCTAVVTFARGTRYLLETDTPANGLPADEFIHGTEGSLKVVGRAELYRQAAGGWERVEPLADTDQFTELAAWMAGGPEHRNSGRRSWTTLETMLACYESVRTRGLVELPLINPDNPLEQLIDEGRLPLESPQAYDIRLKR